VAIADKDGRIGLQRDPSNESALSGRRKLSGDTEGGNAVASSALSTPPAATAGKPGDSLFKTLTNGSDRSADREPAGPASRTGRTGAGLTMETIQQSPARETAEGQEGAARTTEPAAEAQKRGQGESEKRSTDSPRRVPGSTQQGDKPAQGGQSGGQTPGAGVGKGGQGGGATNGNRQETTTAVKNAATTGVQPKSPTRREVPKVAVETKKLVPKSISTTKSTTKPSGRSPTLAKTPTSPLKPQTPKLQSKATTENRGLHPEKNATPKASTPKTTISNTPTQISKRPPVIKTSPPSGIGFVKPKPKSPTRPVQLPAGLVTHTAASITKVKGAGETLSRQGGDYAALHSTKRSPSRLSITSTTTAGGDKGLRRQRSTISRQRPSFGPPPRQPARDHPVTKREREVDAGFLERMMRPTQSSQQKTNDKAPVTPPRKLSAPPKVKKVTSNAGAPAMKKLESNVKKIVPKAAAAAEANPTLEKVVPVVEQTASADEPIAMAKKEEEMVPLVTETEESPKSTLLKENIEPLVEEEAKAPLEANGDVGVLHEDTEPSQEMAPDIHAEEKADVHINDAPDSALGSETATDSIPVAVEEENETY